MKLIDKDDLVAEINKRIIDAPINNIGHQRVWAYNDVKDIINTLEAKEVDLENELNDFIERQKAWVKDDWVVEYNNGDSFNHIYDLRDIAKHFFELGNKAQKGEIWQVVDNVNHPQAYKNKIYCVFTKDRYILATVINHRKDEELLQWKCTEFPHHRYDMCEGDKYMVIN